jgi:flagellar assembly protein FliH
MPAGGNGAARGKDHRFHPFVFSTDDLKGRSEMEEQPAPKSVPDFKAIEQEAYRRGYREGEMAAREAGKKTLTPVISTLEEALKELGRVKREIRACAEKEAVELALAVARKIVCQEISSNNQVILNVVREALKKVESKEDIIIKINPGDLKVLERIRCDSPELFKDIGDVVFKGDPGLSNGGCIIETRLGEVDARIERQLMAVEEAFRTELSAMAPAE